MVKNNDCVTIHFKGHTFKTWEGFNEFQKQQALNNPSFDTIVWDYMEHNEQYFVNGQMIPKQGKQGKGKCTYKGKVYEGDMEYVGRKLYVGGEFVKEV